MKRQRGRLPEGDRRQRQFPRPPLQSPNTRSTPAIAHGISKEIGSIEEGKRADLVLWDPAFFGVKPALVLVGGTIATAPMGDPNASIPTPQPVHYRPMFGSFGKAITNSSVTFVSRAALEDGLRGKLGVEKQMVAVENTRGGIGKRSMVLNDALATHRGRPGNPPPPPLRGARRRRTAHLRASHRPADGAEVLSVLDWGGSHVTKGALPP